MTLQRLALTLLALAVTGGHIAMWSSDMPRDMALKLTLINVAGWAVVLLPAYGVARWARVKRPSGGDTPR